MIVQALAGLAAGAAAFVVACVVERRRERRQFRPIAERLRAVAGEDEL